MKILSNDYFSNTAQAPGISHGGPARFAYELSEFLTARGHTWVGVTNYAAVGGETTIKKVRQSKAKQFFHASFDRKMVNAVMNARTAIDPEMVLAPVIASLEKLLRKTKPDIVFLNGYALFSWMLLRAARTCGIPIVMMHAGIWQKETEIYADYFTQHGRNAALDMEKQISSYATKEIFLNEFSWNYYNKNVTRVSKQQALVIPLPSHTVVRAKTIAAPDNVLRIGIVARWDRIKNHAAVVALAREIKKNKLPWQIFAVTKVNESKIKIRLKTAYKKLVTVVDPMDSSDLNAFIARMDIMILPSIFDVSPGVVLEAAQLGKVTLISPTVGFIKEYHDCGLQSAVCSFEKPSVVIARIKNLHKKSFTAELKKLLSIHASEKIYMRYERVMNDAIKKPRI